MICNPLPIIFCSLVGMLLGLTIAKLCKKIFSNASLLDMFGQFSKLVPKILYVESLKDLMQFYKRLFKSCIKLVFISFAFALMVGSPLFIFFQLGSFSMLNFWNKSAPYMEIYPSSAAAYVSPRSGIKKINDRAVINKASVQYISIPSYNISLHKHQLDKKIAISNSPIWSILFEAFNFKIFNKTLNSPHLSYIVIRPSYKDINIIWPIMSDFEFMFVLFYFVALITVGIKK